MSDALAELMQVLAPERLVPGDPGGTDSLAQTMLRFSDVFADAAHNLGLVDVVWVGQAARAYRDEFGLQPSGPLDLRAALVGLQDRLSGIEKLDAARDHLNQPVSKAARTLRDAMATAPQRVTAAEHAVNFACLAS